MKVRLDPKQYFFLLPPPNIWLYLHPKLLFSMKKTYLPICNTARSVVNIYIWQCILARKYTSTAIKKMEFSACGANGLILWFRNMHLVKSRLMGLPCSDGFKYVLKCFPEAELNRWKNFWNKKTENQKALKDGYLNLHIILFAQIFTGFLFCQ